MNEDRYAVLARRFDETTAARAEHQRLTSRLAALQPQLREAEQELERLGRELEKERTDVRRLESRGISPARVWASVRGDLTERLTAEQAEAQAAELAHERARRHRDVVVQEAQRLEAARAALGDVDAGYEAVLVEVRQAAEEPGAVVLRERAAEAGRLLEDVRWRRELDEALAAGSEAYGALQEARKRLDSAEGWSTWDVMGGGMFSSMLKHDELDKAADLLDTASVALQRFSRELADVELPGIDAPMVDGLSRGLDIWFDNVVTDLFVADRIGKAKRQVTDAIRAVDATMLRLHELRVSLG